eukprot:TRINITY_DN15114_c0_g1_i1.p2 TRINITY_DN15114_c0_g1~~TRINITY_DN15114_c0_g1_i1.p2  ORF type:complete len:309 (+),score=75.33 TRINITY_DN15114_c0_g1_i1:58-927(+)
MAAAPAAAAARIALGTAHGSAAKLFGHGATYAAFRPTYPAALFEAVSAYVGPHAPRDLAVDVACGNGQATVPLAGMYKSVLAFDASEGQIKSAAAGALPNIEFRVGLAEQLPQIVGSRRADLVVVAQALHWFDIPLFYQQALSVLKPGGTLAVWTYGVNIFANKQAEATFYDLYDGVLGRYWSDRRSLVETGLKGHEPSAPWTDVQRMVVPLEVTMPLGNFVGYLRSWSAYQEYMRAMEKEHGAGHVRDPLPATTNRFLEIFGLQSLDDPIPVRWDLNLLLARAPASKH